MRPTIVAVYFVLSIAALGLAYEANWAFFFLSLAIIVGITLDKRFPSFQENQHWIVAKLIPIFLLFNFIVMLGIGLLYWIADDGNVERFVPEDTIKIERTDR